MIAQDPAIGAALERGGIADLTTIGRRTGLPRRIEIAFHNVDGRILLSGRPGFPRGWVANIRANPNVVLHLKRGVQADLPATGRVITDRAERERLLPPIAAGWKMDLGIMVTGSPLVEVTIG